MRKLANISQFEKLQESSSGNMSGNSVFNKPIQFDVPIQNIEIPLTDYITKSYDNPDFVRRWQQQLDQVRQAGGTKIQTVVDLVGKQFVPKDLARLSNLKTWREWWTAITKHLGFRPVKEGRTLIGPDRKKLHWDQRNGVFYTAEIMSQNYEAEQRKEAVEQAATEFEEATTQYKKGTLGGAALKTLYKKVLELCNPWSDAEPQAALDFWTAFTDKYRPYMQAVDKKSAESAKKVKLGDVSAYDPKKTLMHPPLPTPEKKSAPIILRDGNAPLDFTPDQDGVWGLPGSEASESKEVTPAIPFDSGNVVFDPDGTYEQIHNAKTANDALRAWVKLGNQYRDKYNGDKAPDTKEGMLEQMKEYGNMNWLWMVTKNRMKALGSFGWRKKAGLSRVDQREIEQRLRDEQAELEQCEEFLKERKPFEKSYAKVKAIMQQEGTPSARLLKTMGRQANGLYNMYHGATHAGVRKAVEEIANTARMLQSR